MPVLTSARRLAGVVSMILATTVFLAMTAGTAQAQPIGAPVGHRIHNIVGEKNGTSHHRRFVNRRDRKIHHGLEVAISKKGDPYVYGAAGPSRFDCSGLTMFSFGKAGLYLPRSAAAQYSYVRHIPKSKLHRGDLIFFHSGGYVYHVAIFLGRHDHKVWLLHAPHTGTVVQRDPIWTTSWWAGTLRRRG